MSSFTICPQSCPTLHDPTIPGIEPVSLVSPVSNWQVGSSLLVIPRKPLTIWGLWQRDHRKKKSAEDLQFHYFPIIWLWFILFYFFFRLNFFLFCYFILFFNFTILYWFCQISTWIREETMLLFLYLWIYRNIFMVCGCAKPLQSCPILCNPMDCSLPGFTVHGILQARILGVGCHALLQGIFSTQESNPHLLWHLHCRQILYFWATREVHYGFFQCMDN